MRFDEFIDIADLELNITYKPSNVGPFIAQLKKPFFSVDYKDSRDDAMLRGRTGWGKTADEAIDNLIVKLNEGGFLVTRPGDYSKHHETSFLKIPKLER